MSDVSPHDLFALPFDDRGQRTAVDVAALGAHVDRDATSTSGEPSRSRRLSGNLVFLRFKPSEARDKVVPVSLVQ